MSVDKNLFLYDLAIVAVMKCEGSYIKEWLDYHLLAGVDHFFIYDNDSPDNQKEILQPYIDAGLVTYTFFPGSSPQFPAYNDAIQRFKYLCRYIAFIDGDEFILPKSNRSIIEVVDEILSDKPNIGGLGITWHCFGSSGQVKADYNRGVLERFTYRAPTEFNPTIKDIVNPRKINFFDCPHRMNYYGGFYTIDENASILLTIKNKSCADKKIVINHYVTKSFEEYMEKNQRGDVVYTVTTKTEENFKSIDAASTIFDDSILKYRAERQVTQIPTGGGMDAILATLAPRKQVKYGKIYSALINNLAPILPKNVPLNFFEGKMETLLTCLALNNYLRKNVLDEKTANLFEEVALNLIYKTLMTHLQFADIKLLFSELPNILKMNYTVVKEIRNACVQIIPQLLRNLRANVRTFMPLLWREYFYLEEKLYLLKAFDN